MHHTSLHRGNAIEPNPGDPQLELLHALFLSARTDETGHLLYVCLHVGWNPKTTSPRTASIMSKLVVRHLKIGFEFLPSFFRCEWGVVSTCLSELLLQRYEVGSCSCGVGTVREGFSVRLLCACNDRRAFQEVKGRMRARRFM